MRVVIADDEALLREGLARLLAEAGIEVVGQAATAPEALAQRQARPQPDVAIVDIRMPPGHADDGLIAAQQIRREHPGSRRARALASPRVALRDAAARRSARARRLPAQGARVRRRRARRRAAAHRRGRVRGRPDDRRAADERAPRAQGPLDELTDREREVLALIAEGLSNQRDLRPALPQPQDRRGARAPDLHEARAARGARTSTAACRLCSHSCVRLRTEALRRAAGTVARTARGAVRRRHGAREGR